MKKLLKTYSVYQPQSDLTWSTKRFKTPRHMRQKWSPKKSKGLSNYQFPVSVPLKTQCPAPRETKMKPKEIKGTFQVPVPPLRSPSQDPRPSATWDKNETRRNQRDFPSTSFPISPSQDPRTKNHLQDPRPVYKIQDPFPRPKIPRAYGMVKLLPIPSLKKVRITKTKTPTNKSPQDSQSQKNLLTRHDAPERSWSNPHCYLSWR